MIENGYLTLSGNLRLGDTVGECGQLNSSGTRWNAWLWVAYSDNTGLVFNVWVDYLDTNYVYGGSIMSELTWGKPLKYPIDLNVVNTEPYMMCVPAPY
jgi:hypothetical protein